jgi:hypothetical protein
VGGSWVDSWSSGSVTSRSMETRYSVSEMSVFWDVSVWFPWWLYMEDERTGDFFGKDGVENLSLFCLFFSTHSCMWCDLSVLW